MVRVALAVKASARTAEREPTAVLELGAAGDWSVKNSRARRVPPLRGPCRRFTTGLLPMFPLVSAPVL